MIASARSSVLSLAEKLDAFEDKAHDLGQTEHYLFAKLHAVRVDHPGSLPNDDSPFPWPRL